MGRRARRGEARGRRRHEGGWQRTAFLLIADSGSATVNGVLRTCDVEESPHSYQLRLDHANIRDEGAENLPEALALRRALCTVLFPVQTNEAY